MKAAIARRVITPEIGTELAGYGSRDRPATQISDDLWLTVLALEGANRRQAVLVTADLLGFDKPHVAELRRRLQHRHGLEPEQVFFNASHTHYGPATSYFRATEFHQVDPAYVTRLSLEILEAVAEALAHLEPAELRLGVGQSHVGINRRLVTPQGVQMAPNPEGPFDPTVVVMEVRRPQKPAALLVNYACHPVTRGAAPVISADYVGSLRRDLAERLGTDTAVVFLQGACGDVRPRIVDASGSRFIQGGAEHVERFGRQLAADAAAALPGAKAIDGPVYTASRHTQLPLVDVPDEAGLEALMNAPDATRRMWAQAMARRWRAFGRLPAWLDYEVQAIGLGRDLVIVGAEGEVCNGYARRARAEVWPDRTVAFAGYANGYPGYIPTRQVLQEGGYEGDSARWGSDLAGRFSPAIEDAILTALHELRKGTAP